MSRYGIAEWFGEPLRTMPAVRRRTLARKALGHDAPPPCPFQRHRPPCGKAGGVCSIRTADGLPVVTCPRRFEEGGLIPAWLARIVGFPEVHMAREVPFMRSPATGKAAGRIDLVVARDGAASSWFGLEIQAVYFSGKAMRPDFELLATNDDATPPEPTGIRRPDWRSSSAKRLMPQLQVKGPTLIRWGSKLAVAVDMPFFEAIGGPSAAPSHDLNDGDILWLVPRVTAGFRLEECHWEVLSLDESSRKLLAATTVKRDEFETALRAKLERIGRSP